MMRYAGIRPPYPAYVPQPYLGDLPPLVMGPQDHRGPFGPDDMYPSQVNPAYTAYGGARGRFLAGIVREDAVSKLQTLATAGMFGALILGSGAALIALSDESIDTGGGLLVFGGLGALSGALIGIGVGAVGLVAASKERS